MSRRTAAIAGGGVAALALILALLVIGQPQEPSGHAGPSSSATAPAATSSAAPSGASSTQPSPTAPGGWAALELPPYEPIAELVPDAADGSGVSTTTSFTLRSLTSTPALDLAAGLVVEPVVDLRAEAGPSPEVAVVHLVSPLVENARYEFRLRGTDGALAGEWTFRTGGPLHVVRLLPDDHSTQVPIDTGIEIEFDQDGAVGVGDHFSIEPAVDGRFETHGRTWVFVPTAELDPSTLYIVTLTAGVAISDSDQVLESNVRFAFETTGPRSELAEARIVFDRPMHEARPDEPAVIPVQVYANTGETLTTTREVVVYGLATLDAAREGATILAVDRDWAVWSANGGVPTAGLPQTASFEATVGLRWPNQYLQLPTGLAAGWYLVEVPQEGRDAQLVLQVTDLAAYVLVAEGRMIAWVNDLGPEAPVANASVLLADGSTLGQTDAAGLLDRATPAALVADPGGAGDPRLLIVSSPDERSILAVPGTGTSWYWGPQSSSSWWHLFGTDRTQYRRNDTIHAWGLVRARSDRSVPGGLELRLVSGWDVAGPPIARTSVTATPRGVVVGDLPVRDLPAGSYTVALFVGEESVSQASVQVTEIRKPTFQVEVTSERRAYIHGEQVRVRAAANFFDGSTAPGLRLRVTGSGVRGEDERVVTIDATGAAELMYEAATSDTTMESGGISASPAQPEEGSSSGSASFVVFPSTAWIDGEATVDEDRVTISGRLSRVDLAAADAQMATGWVEDPSGEALPGRRVQIVVDRVTWRPVQIGTTYDFVLKRSVPLLEYEREVEPLGTFQPTTGTDGTFAQSLPFDGAGGVEVTVRATDESGRAIEQHLWAQTPSPEVMASFPYLETPAIGCGSVAGLSAAVGENVSLTVRAGEGEPSVEGRTLFVVGHLGIDDVVLTSGAELQRVFAESDLPSLTVRAIRFTDAGYLVTNDVLVRVDDQEKAIEVVVEPGRDRYVPGDEATVTVITRRADGSPIAADVVLQAIDLKLFAMGAAHEISTAGLMAPVPSGFVDSYVTHRVPPPLWGDGCGAATGGGEPREDFEDAATFQLVTTGVDGRGEASFEMPDDLTSWVVSATAMGDGLESGTGSVEVPVGLPFFVDATIAPEYLVGEEPILQLRAYGDALEAGDRVRFTIEAPSLGLEATAIDGQAFEPVRAPLPVLALGEHEMTISGERLGTGTELRDAVRRTVRVVPTRLRTQRTASEAVTESLRPTGGDGMTTYLVTDAGRGGLAPLLQELATGSSARFDASLAAEVAREILIEEFGMSETSLPLSGYAGSAGHPAEGLALLPHGSADLFLTARTTLVAPERVDGEYLATALRTAADEASSRERRIVALAGLAGLGRDVLDDLRAVATDELTVRERAWLALGLLASGEEADARTIERAILTQYGQRLDRWVRLDVGVTTPERAEVTASVMLLAAGLRDPVAADISRFLLDNPSQEYLPALEQIGFARAAMEWLPREEARFAWTVDGERHEETLERGAAFTVALTAAQRESFVIEHLAGELLVTSTWAGEARYDELPANPTVTVSRSVSPADHAPADDLVRVTLEVRFGDEALEGCYQVTDFVPSGLAPVVSPLAYGNGDPNVIAPYEVEGQRVSWCVGTDRPSVRLGYAARVVSSGTYRWEPAVVQLAGVPSIGAATSVVSYSID